MFTSKITIFCFCYILVNFAEALVRQRPVIGGFSPINEEDLKSDLVKEASNGAIKMWNQKTFFKNYFKLLG
jgi:hypothetical protein